MNLVRHHGDNGDQPEARVVHQSMFWFALALLIIAAVSPPDGLGLIACPFRAATGLPCPGCGVTRSVTLLLRGRVSESWEMHPFGLPILFVLVTIIGVGLMARRRRAWMRLQPRVLRLGARAAMAVLLLSMACLWLWRLCEAVSAR